MTAIQGGAAASIAASAEQTSKKVQAIPALGKQNTTFTERTKGSVFGSNVISSDKGGSDAKTQVAIINAAYQGNKPNNSAKAQVAEIGKTYAASAPPRAASANIGNILNGNNFTSLTMRSKDDKGTAAAPTRIEERNKDIDHTKTSDEMLAIANNLTMKDMWQAA